MPRGKFIVIDGSDGTGKATQTKLLIKRLQKAGHKVKFEDFPQYGKKSAGPVEDYLTGQYGNAKDLGPYVPSMFYAVDRFAAAERIRRHLKQGFIVVCNRYVTSNMAHQGGKIENSAAREKYFKWLTELEYKFFKIPKPDQEIILHLPAKVSYKLLKKRGPTYYIGSVKRDIHEMDIKHLMNAEKIYLQIAKRFHYPVIQGFINNQLLTPQEISDKVYAVIRN
jgi:dTMP kinase